MNKNRLKINLWPHLKPEFLIIGAQKSGTTALYSYLSQHPAILPARVKEVHYFDYHFDRGWRWYMRRFPTSWRAWRTGKELGHRIITGEASPCYMFFPHAPRRAHQKLPNAKIIALLRNPVDRAYSHYQMMTRNPIMTIPGTKQTEPREPLSFEEALATEEGRMKPELEKMEQDEFYRGLYLQMHSYKLRGHYAQHLKHWMQFFPRERLLVVDSARLSKETASVYNEVVQFLDIPAWQPEEFKREHEGGYSEPMKPETRAQLVKYFRPHNEELYELLGRRFDWDK